MVKNAYIHIPFCKSKCKYCSFISFNKPELITDYISALIREISKNYKGELLDTLYFGGGTPSLIQPELIGKVISRFNFAPDAEITLELNPDDLERIPDLKRIGINRLSIGSQTFDDKILKLAGRRHNSMQIIEAVELAKRTGFTNISVDLIYGFPQQTIQSIKSDLEKLLRLDIQHISTYGLKIEQESAWGKNTPDVPDDDLQADMYLRINEVLASRGFCRYEVSNFAKKGYESRHNLNYWNNAGYYGFGAAAHGYVDGIRYSNTETIEEYLGAGFPRVFEHVLTQKEKLEEEIFLGFRKTEGINTQKIKDLYGVDFELKYENILKKYSDYFIKTPRGYALTLQGMLLSNVILSEFL